MSVKAEYKEVNLKRKSVLFLSVIMIMTLFLPSCKSNSSSKNDKLQIVTTVFPAYDWTREVLGEQIDNVDLTMLLDSGTDLHSYQPTADDIAKISDCDVFIYVGGESDDWVDDALKEAKNKDMKVINLLDTLGDKAKEEESKEGMQADEDHEHEHDHDGDHHDKHEHDHDGDHHDDDNDEDEPEYDEHVWLSLKNAKLLVQAISDKLSEADSSNSERYAANAKSYIDKLSELDASYAKAAKDGSKKTMVFADRFPFRYLTDDYNIDYYAAFNGCSAESEASFETVIFLAKKIDELGLNSIMKIESKDNKIAQSVKDNTAKKNQQILTMNSMQSITAKDVKDGTTYMSIMQDNLKTFTEALK